MSGSIVLGVCLALAQESAIPPVFVPTQTFTLVWTHSIEKVQWQEQYKITEGPNGQAQLVAGFARIKGSGAGMEPPDDAVLRDGWYVYQPSQPSEQGLQMMRSPYVADYTWCVGGACVPMSDLLPSDGGVTHLYPCTAPASD